MKVGVHRHKLELCQLNLGIFLRGTSEPSIVMLIHIQPQVPILCSHNTSEYSQLVYRFGHLSL